MCANLVRSPRPRHPIAAIASIASWWSRRSSHPRAEARPYGSTGESPRSMTRVISICLGLLICLGGSAWGDKPKIAILGLEAAAGAGGAIDPGAQLVAREITRELRQRVQSPASPYVIAPNSNKELLDEKLLMSCENEALDCMVVIAAGLASDLLLYGRV